MDFTREEEVSIQDIMSLKIEGLFGATIYNNRENLKQQQQSLNMNIENCGPRSLVLNNNTESLDLNSCLLSPSRRCLKGMINCRVCGDRSSGKHYGVNTCEGCKSFFKRTIRRNLKYSCKTGRNCVVDQYRRNNCQFCRMKKCIHVGMQKEAVQPGRKKSSNFKKTTTTSKPSIKEEVPPSFTDQLIRAEPFGTNDENNALETPSLNLNNYELLTQNVLAIIKWSKNIQFFSTLSQNDQFLLIKSSWKELFLINLFQQKQKLIKTNFTDHHHISSTFDSWISLSSPSCTDDNAINIIDHEKTFQEQMSQWKALEVDPVEYSSLKAVLLFSPDVPGLSNPTIIKKIQGTTTQELESYVNLKYDSQRTRFGKLLLRLLSLRTIQPFLLDRLYFSYLGGVSIIENLIHNIIFTDADSYIKNWVDPSST